MRRLGPGLWLGLWDHQRVKHSFGMKSLPDFEVYRQILRKHTIINTQGAQQTSCRMGSEIPVLRHPVIKWWRDRENLFFIIIIIILIVPKF